MGWKFYEGIRHRPVATWQSGGVSRLMPYGRLLGLSDEEGLRIRRCLSQSVFYRDVPERTALPERTVKARAFLHALRKMLTRSDLCPIAQSVEAVVRAHIASRYDIVSPQPLGLEVAKQLILRWSATRRTQTVESPLERYDDEPDGARKERGIWSYLQACLDGQLAPWSHPQMPFSAVLEEGDDRRADFIVAPPWTSPHVWEVHGVLDPNDRFKSEVLRQHGYGVFDQLAGKTTKSEVDAWLERFRPAPELSSPLGGWELYLVEAPWVASQVDMALLHLLEGNDWSCSAPHVCIVVDEEYQSVARAAASAWKELAEAVQAVWLGDDSDHILLARSMTITVNEPKADLEIRIEPEGPTYRHWEEQAPPHCLIVRHGYFPCDIPAPQAGIQVRARLTAVNEDAMRTILKRLFDKDGFRPGQLDAIAQAASGEDSLILLPTGYGKSLIFQMAALLLPGMTLVVEPYRSLIDDQERNLHDAGIGNILTIHSGRTRVAKEDLPKYLMRVFIVYVSAERMHIQEFASAFRDRIREQGLALFVVDEAHTVSQFGHSFRPAYLDLPERLQAIVGKAGATRPPTVALTATAAQRVVRDIQALLRIATDPVSLENSASARYSFARKHLEDEIIELRSASTASSRSVQAQVGDASPDMAIRRAIDASLANLPTGQGIVFCPSKGDFKGRATTWRSPLFGAKGLRDVVQELKGPGVGVGLYTGGSDADHDHMREDARRFSRNEIHVMVATSAFGTGIDLQGVRWTVHIGLPGGLDAYYQESGRAGRDGSNGLNRLVVDWDSDDLLVSIAGASASEDPMSDLQEALQKAKKRGSIARQLGLLIGDLPPDVDKWSLLEEPKREDGGKTFRPSFPGWKWEAKNVDKAIIKYIIDGGERELWYNVWWEDIVWKALYRLAILGIVRHGFEHDFKTKGRSCFRVDVCDFASCLRPETLVDKVEEEVRRIATPDDATQARRELQLHLPGKGPVDRVYYCSAMLLKMLYKVVYQTRIESLRSLVRYAREPELSERREIIEDYFAPSDLKREIFRLCEKSADQETLVRGLELAEGESRWRSAIFEVAASEYPGALLPQLLMAVGGIRKLDAAEAAGYALSVLSTASVDLSVREWCLGEILERARHARIVDEVLESLGKLLKPGVATDVLEAIGSRLATEDGVSLVAHQIVHRFLADALEMST